MIEEAKLEDLPRIVEIEKEISLRIHPNEELGVSVEDIEAVGFGDDRIKKYQERYFDNPDGGMWVAKEAGKIVGFSAGTKGADKNWIGKLYVLHDFAHTGLGSQLLAAAEDWLGTDKPVAVGVATQDGFAKSFYVGHKYVEAGARPAAETTVPSTGKVIPEILMVKSYI